MGERRAGGPVGTVFSTSGETFKGAAANASTHKKEYMQFVRGLAHKDVPIEVRNEAEKAKASVFNHWLAFAKRN